MNIKTLIYFIKKECFFSNYDDVWFSYAAYFISWRIPALTALMTSLVHV